MIKVKSSYQPLERRHENVYEWLHYLREELKHARITGFNGMKKFRG